MEKESEMFKINMLKCIGKKEREDNPMRANSLGLSVSYYT